MSGRPGAEAPKVLLVDDDHDILKTLRLFLGYNGFDVVEATGGAEGCLLAHKELPDVILLDVMMPDIDGFEACQELKANCVTRDIPVIFISAMADQDSIEKGLSLGASAYIAKPFKARDLLMEIRKVTANKVAGVNTG